MFGYIYITTNIVTGKRYIGKKKVDKGHENYFGSSKWLKNDIKILGIDNFKKDIIEYCLNAADLNKREIYYQKLWNVKLSNDWYNMHIQTEDFDTTGLRFKYTDEQKKKIWSKERRRLMSEKMKINNLNNLSGVSEAKSQRLKKDNPSFRADVKSKLSDIKSRPFCVKLPCGKVVNIKNNREFFNLFGFDVGFLKRKGKLKQGRGKGFEMVN
jgi:group I intron endonuclease